MSYTRKFAGDAALPKSKSLTSIDPRPSWTAWNVRKPSEPASNLNFLGPALAAGDVSNGPSAAAASIVRRLNISIGCRLLARQRDKSCRSRVTQAHDARNGRYGAGSANRSEEHTSEHQSLMR